MLWRFIAVLSGNLSTILGDESAGGGGAVADAVGDIAEAVATPAANSAQDAPGLFGNPIVMVLIYAVIIVGAYFLLMRPQRKRDKKMKEMQSSIKTGDNVVTTGGFFGRVADVGEDCFIIEFGTNRGIRIPVQKTDVLGIKAPKTTPAPKDAIEKKED
ncbi:MAG: preprotein translocase subunit YajC [Defluviitaleaceae bacterium]|nr:preprotein translocase subunit YajC [Defluviitaleaceae bacterium]